MITIDPPYGGIKFRIELAGQHAGKTRINGRRIDEEDLVRQPGKSRFGFHIKENPAA
jgi:hypothetical protein